MAENICLMMTIKEFLDNTDREYTVIKDHNKTSYTFSKDRCYSIPSYQREIRWEAKNVEILLKDLESSKKFLGSILINHTVEQKYDIIDGQQRISVLLLILQYFKRIKLSTFSHCSFINNTYDKLFDVVNLDFDDEKIKKSPNCQQYEESDILDQRKRFKTIWDSIKKEIDSLDLEKRRTLLDNLLYSSINLILVGDPDSKIYVDYYLDLNDKAVKLDHLDILKAILFKIDYDLMSSKWAELQKAFNDLRNHGMLNYSIDSFYYHYFACTVNPYLDFKLSFFKSDMKFIENLEINGSKYSAGTNVLRAISDISFFSDSIDQLKDLVEFLSNIYLDSNLTQYKEKLKACNCNNNTIECVFEIISLIIRNDDEVPKMLIIKYFLEVINKASINKSDVKLIFYIYVYSILFTLTGGKKESSKLIRVVLSKDWRKKLMDNTIRLWKDNLGKINRWKRITRNNKLDERSGAYLPKHVFAMLEFSKVSNTSISFREKQLKEYLLSISSTAEHFFIPQSYKLEFEYGQNHQKTTISIPRKLKKHISCPFNYIYINSTVNESIGNMPIKNKIDYLLSVVEHDKSVFLGSNYNYQYLVCIKEALDEMNDYPNLSLIDSEEDAKILIENYYKDHLIDVITKSIDKFNTFVINQKSI